MPAADSADTAASRSGFVSRLRGLLAVLLCALAAAAFLCLGLAFLAVFLTVLLWDEYRLLALGVFTALFLGGGAGLAWLALARARDGRGWFAATRQELARDCERLRS